MSDDDSDTLADGVGAVRHRADALGSALSHPRENRLTRWVLLTGSRLWVSAALLLGVFLSLLALASIRPLDVRDLLTETTAAQMLFSSLLSGVILLVSIVVSINSITLSQEITDIESQQDRIAASIDYRRHIEGLLEADIVPARPAEFLTAVLYAISRRTNALQRTAGQRSLDGFQDQVEEFAAEVETEIHQAREGLANVRLGTIDVLLVGLKYDYAGQLHAARALKRSYSDELDEETEGRIDDLIEVLQHVATGREFFKSLYYKRELARLSSLLLYVSIPVIVFTSYVILALDANLFPSNSLFGLSPLLLYVILAYTVALAPFIVLTSFVVRAATITLRTLAAGPFIPQSGSEIEFFDWEVLDEDRDWDLGEQSGDG